MSSYITESGRSTNKFKLIKRHFSVRANLKGRYKQFEQKCVREVTVDGRSISLLIEKIKKNDKFLMNQYINPELKMALFSEENLKAIELIIQDYNLLVTKLLIIHLKGLKNVGERVIQNNLSSDLKKLQCVFIESFSIAIYAIHCIKFLPKRFLVFQKNRPNLILAKYKQSHFLKYIHKSKLNF